MSDLDKYTSLFYEFGFVLNNFVETHNILDVDQRQFQNRLQEQYENSSDELKQLKSFLDSYLKNDTNFLISLLPTKNNAALINSHSSNQDNLLRVLLELEQLQSHLFDLLMNKIVFYCGESNQQDKQILSINLNVPIYIINQFRYLPKIGKPKELCKKLIDLIGKLGQIQIKRQIISCFPDILGDCEHDELMDELEELLDDTELVSVTLDTIGDLKLNQANVHIVVKKLFDNFDLLNEKDLVSMIGFVLKAACDLNSKEIFNRLREMLKLEAIKEETNRMAVFNKLREYFYISNKSLDIYFQLMNPSSTSQTTLNGQNNVKAIDFLLFSIIYTRPQYAKEADKLFKLILKNESFECAEKCIECVFKYGTKILKELFNAVLSMAKSLINSSNDDISCIGNSIYTIGFVRLGDRNLKKHLISALLELINCSNGPATDNSLDVLMDLCRQQSTNHSLVPYSSQLKTLLDNLEFFNLNQIRKVYFIVCTVAYLNGKRISGSEPSVSSIETSLLNSENPRQLSADLSLTTNSNIQDSLHMLINKQLSSSNLKSKQIGIIGALMMIKNMALKGNAANANKSIANGDSSLAASQSSEDFFSCPSSQSVTLNRANSTSMADTTAFQLTTVSNEIKQIWQMIIDSSKLNPESLGLFEDELTSILLQENDSISDNIKLLIKENLKEMNQNLFKVDSDHMTLVRNVIGAGAEKLLKSINIGFDFGIDFTTPGALNLIPHILNDMRKKNHSLMEQHTATSKSYLPSIAIPSTFRLMAILEQRDILCLKDYIGLPVLSIKKDDLFKYANKFDANTTNSSNLANSTISAGNNNWLYKFKELLSNDQRRLICDCMFVLINWFIEIINGFSSKIDHSEENYDICCKLMQRLTCVYELKQALICILPYMKLYKAPLAVFGLIDSSSDELPYIHTLIKVKEVKKKAAPAKRKKPNTKKLNNSKKGKTTTNEDSNEEGDHDEDKENKILVNDTDEEENENESDESNLEDKENQGFISIDAEKLSIHFREFDLSVINFVNLELELVEIIPDTAGLNNSQPQPSKLTIKSHLLYFLLCDINKKLALLFKSTSSNSPLAKISQTKMTKMQLFIQQINTSPREMAQNIVNNCLDGVFSNLDSIYRHIKKIQVNNDGIRDTPQICNNQKNLNLLKCFNQLIKFSLILLTYISAHNETRLIETFFKKLLSKMESSNSNSQRLAEFACFNYVTKLKDVVYDLNTAEILIQLLDQLGNKTILDLNG